MRRLILLTCCVIFLALAIAQSLPARAQDETPRYTLIGSAFGGITAAPSAGGDYSLVGATGPDAQQSLSGGDYSMTVGSPVTQERPIAPDEEEPEEEESGPDTLYLPAVER